MPEDEEENIQFSEDMEFIEKNLISLIKNHSYLYDSTQYGSEDDEIRDTIIRETYDTIAMKLTELMEDRYVFLGKYF